jgi:hypothetical protein
MATKLEIKKSRDVDSENLGEFLLGWLGDWINDSRMTPEILEEIKEMVDGKLGELGGDKPEKRENVLETL